MRICIETVDAGDPHPNTYRVTLRNAREQHSLIAISTGGGMMEVIAVDGFAVSLSGDCYETLFWVKTGGPDLVTRLAGRVTAGDILLHECGDDLERALAALKWVAR